MAHDDYSTKMPVWQYAVSAAAGVSAATVAAVTTIRAEFYKNIRGVKDVAEHLEKSGKAIEAYAQEVLTRAKGPNPICKEVARKETRVLKRANHNGFAGMMEKMHYRSALPNESGKVTFGQLWHEYAPGTLDRASQMGAHSRNQVIMSTVITAAIGAGATMTFFNNHHTRHKMDELYRRLNDQQQART
jgi:hypothetical protein